MTHDPVDMRASITPNSDQLNYEDFTAGPQTYTVTDVTRGTKDQPVFIHLAEAGGRTYRPSKSMRRVIVAGWTADAKTYPGKKLTLYGDPAVRWAGKPVGGIRISHMSHIDGPLTVQLVTGPGKREPFTVQPLPMDEAAAAVDEPGLIAQIHQTRTVEEITALAEHLKTIDAPAAAMEVARKQWANLTKQNGTDQS